MGGAPEDTPYIYDPKAAAEILGPDFLDEISAEVCIIHKCLDRVVSKVTCERARLLSKQRDLDRQLEQHHRERAMWMDRIVGLCKKCGVDPVEYGVAREGEVKEDEDGLLSESEVSYFSTTTTADCAPSSRPQTARPRASKHPIRAVISNRPSSAPPVRPSDGGAAQAPLREQLPPDNIWTTVCKLLHGVSGSVSLTITGPDTRVMLHNHARSAGFRGLSNAVSATPEGPTSLVLQSIPPPTVAPRTEDGVERRRGIIHYIATGYGKRPWCNPSKGGAVVTVTSQRTGTDSGDLVKPTVGYFATLDKPHQHVMIDLGYPAVIPTHYSLASAHPVYGGYYPRCWILQGSRDGKAWHDLSVHQDDESITYKTPYAQWAVHPPIEVSHLPMQLFRILSTGHNSFASFDLQVSSFELYGKLLHCTPFPEIGSTPPPSTDHTRSRYPAPLLPLPPQPVIQETRKRKKIVKKKRSLG